LSAAFSSGALRVAGGPRRHLAGYAQDVFDETTEFGARAAARMREDTAIWLATVAPDGTPQPTPVWFLWDGAKSVLIYSQPHQAKLRNVAHNGRASLNLDGNRHGGNIVVCHGDIAVSDDPAVDQMPAYLEKYRERIGGLGQTVEQFAALFTVSLRFTMTHVRGH
jgi:PPOX class probable F420-dependent enzyme